MTSEENRLQDSTETLDIEEVKRRIRANKERILQAIEASITNHGGDMIQQIDLSNDYPVVEGKRRTKRAKKVESDVEKSPLQ